MKQLAQRLLPPQLFAISAGLMLALHMSFPVVHILGTHALMVGATVIALGVSVTLSGSTEFKRIGTNIKTFNEPEVMVTEGSFVTQETPCISECTSRSWAWPSVSDL